MAPAKPPSDDDKKQPTTPRRASVARPNGTGKRSGGATPPNRKTGPSPKSAPAAAAGVAAGGVRKQSASAATAKKGATEPSLLGDFLLGRPSAARVAAARRKSVDATAVKAEIRKEMRAEAVRKVQQPGGVKDRVKTWQKANAAAMAKGDPDDAATEPTEVAAQIDAESVTEEDRVRIKSRQKPKRKPATPKAERSGAEDNGESGKDNDDSRPPDSRLNLPPKKRIVSDDNWMKRRNAAIAANARKRSPPRPAVAKPKPEPTPIPIPKDFLQKTAKNPKVQDKIKDWAKKVEIPEDAEPPEIPKSPRKYSTKAGETITVEEDDSSRRSSGVKSGSGRTGDDGIRVRPMKPAVSADDGIRVKPIRKQQPANDGIRVKPLKPSPLPDDGIRVRSMDGDAPERSRERKVRVPSTRRDRTPSTRIEVIEEPESEVQTPTRKSKRVSPRVLRSVTAPMTETATTRTGGSDDDRSWSDDDATSRDESDRPSSAPEKTLVDIPFGYSAFSELDLPVGADHHHLKRPKAAQRNSSFKAVPKAFKKIVREAKEIVKEQVDPQKPVVNQPPSIESWLNGTVDPFVDKSTPKPKAVEKEWEKDTQQKRSSLEARPKQEPPSTVTQEDNQENDPPREEAPKKEPEPSPKPTGLSGLKRSRATRGSSSPVKPGNGKPKRPLREALNGLFRGESSGHKLPTKAYSAYEDLGPDSESEYVEEAYEDERDEARPRSSGAPRGRSPSPESSFVSTDVSSVTEGPYMTPAVPRRCPPPTNGRYELSTIVSEESPSSIGSETMSTLSETTVTQTTALTRSTARSRKSNKSGLKRRLTKHSDLVSVLSLPDTPDDAPVRANSIKSTRSLRRKTSKLEKATLDDLLREFAEDEDFYQRELKTLVDGAVPVLLNQVVHGGASTATDLFGPTVAGDKDAAAKAVVSMGIALEKLKNHHRRVPLHNVHMILSWLDSVHPVYNNYLDVWRLGFDGIVVNLALAPGRLDDNDSLVNALPRNEGGDVVDTRGQPVDLQRLLTRPLARIRGLLKLLKGAQAIGIIHPDLEMTIANLASLQEKARRRHREETARKTDEEAINTDTSRCCDLRTLAPMDGVIIEATRQVNAKDYFSLDIFHSNGQRLECQVELVFRDKPQDPSDKGDLLIRDTTRSRSCLMFPPMPISAMSARKGDEPGVLVAMVRGRHNGREWSELLTLSTDFEDQVLEWISILGTSPVPPRSETRIIAITPTPTSPKPDVNVPIGERRGEGKLRKSLPTPLAPSPVFVAEEKLKPKTPSRYHARHPSSPTIPTTPTSASAPSSPPPERTPTQKSYLDESGHRRSLPMLPPMAEPTTLREEIRPDPKKVIKAPPNSKPFREDGAPPPPVHRTLSSTFDPPPEPARSSRVKRRGSSPLKHECHPSDISSESSESDSGLASDAESSSDELEEDDVPDTTPAISIKHSDPSASESVLSLTPSNSASQVGMYGRLGPGGPKDPEYSIKSIATISYWSNKKGQWKDAWHEACSIVVMPGLIEAHPLSEAHSAPGQNALTSSGPSELHSDADANRMRPLIALELTPVVMIRQSTVVDLEIRSPVRPYSKLAEIDGKIFRFRATSAADGTNLYMAVHRSRLNNAKYKALEDEARFRSFGQQQAPQDQPDSQSSSSRRRNWFGRKNSYRASTRAPSQSQSASQSQGTSSSISAPSLLRRLTGVGNRSFNIDKSYIDRNSRSGSNSGEPSLYTTGSSSASGFNTPRSPSVSLADASGHTQLLGSDNLKIRCHMLVTSSKWEDHGNCRLQITRPPPGMRQELRIRHGMEKRIIVTKVSKKETDKPLIVLDVVLGSKCFGRLGARGIILNVWEDLRDENNNVGLAPKKGGLSGSVKKWCFQCSSATEAGWIYGLVAQEVFMGM